MTGCRRGARIGARGRGGAVALARDELLVAAQCRVFAEERGGGLAGGVRDGVGARRGVEGCDGAGEAHDERDLRAAAGHAREALKQALGFGGLEPVGELGEREVVVFGDCFEGSVVGEEGREERGGERRRWGGGNGQWAVGNGVGRGRMGMRQWLGRRRRGGSPHPSPPELS